MGEITSFNAVDLYCGSGAVSAGLKQAKFKVVAAVDMDPVSNETFQINHPEVNLVTQDILSVSLELFMEFAIPTGEVIHLLTVCAPCQPFSSQNRRRSEDDERTNLILASLPFIEKLKPKIVLFENVPGISNTAILRNLREGLLEIGYQLSELHRLDAALFGTPQRRVRAIMVASPIKAIVENFFSKLKPKEPTTVRQAIGRLKKLKSGEAHSRDGLHFARVHSEVVLKRLDQIPHNGGSRISLPPELELQCHKGKRTSFSDVYGRMAWDTVSPTLTTGCTDVTKGRFAHPDQNRAITLREAALLQTFPRSYKFAGNATQIARQIGNAVPVAMARSLAETARTFLQMDA